MPIAEELSQPLVWLDLEMTGLDPDRDRILEIAVIVTDGALSRVLEGPDLAIHQDDSILSGMDAWNRKHHTESGLVERVAGSEHDAPGAEAQVLEFLREKIEPGLAPLAGNSVHQDRAFLRRWMPRLHDFLHYRNVDVSTLKELARRWAPEVLAEAPPKAGSHRALDDIRESIRELEHYRSRLGEAWDGGAVRPGPG